MILNIYIYNKIKYNYNIYIYVLYNIRTFGGKSQSLSQPAIFWKKTWPQFIWKTAGIHETDLTKIEETYNTWS